MNTKRWIITSLVVFVVAVILDFIVHGILLSGAYQATEHLWRNMDEMQSMMWMMWLSSLIWSFIFVYIFAKGYEGRGIMEGVRFGLLIGVFISLPMALGTYGSMRITFGLAAGWFIYGVIEMIILGILAALLYKPATKPAGTT